MRRLAPLILILLSGLALPAAASHENEAEAACRAAVETARIATAEGRPLTEILSRHEAVERRCASPEVGPALQLQAAARVANGLWVYRKDFAAAIDLYDRSLVEAQARLPDAHPARIELVEGLAAALSSLWSQGRSDIPAANLPRILALHEEAYRLNAQQYGEHSAQAARWLLNLSNLELQDRPDVAEAHARKALENRRDVCGLHGLDVSVALQYLAAALERQGKHAELEDVEALLATVVIDSPACPADCCNPD